MKRFIAGFLCLVMLCGCSTQSTPDTSTESKTKLVLACWQAIPQVLSLVEKYNAMYPNMPIEIKEYYNPDINVDQALRQMDAALVSGDRVDLYCFGSLDLQRLINGNLIADLMPYVEADSDLNNENYYMDILEMFQRNGMLYEMPSFFQIAGIRLPSAAVPEEMTGWTFDEYIELDNALKADGKTVLSMKPRLMLEYLAQYSVDTFFNDDLSQCQFENEDFYALLNFVRDYASGNGGEPIGMDTWILSLSTYIDDIEALGGQPKYVGYPDVEKNGPCVMSFVSYGISSSTAYPEACWNFIKMTLSEDAYLDAGLNEGFPLSRKALTKAMEQFQLSTGDENSPLHGLTDPNGNYYVPLNSTYVPYIYELIDSVTHARFRYSGVFSIIREEGSAFLEDDKTAEETANLIQNRVSIYLSEQH